MFEKKKNQAGWRVYQLEIQIFINELKHGNTREGN